MEGLTTTVVAIAVLNQSREENKEAHVIQNRQGECFTFHGDGTVSVKGIFGEDLGTHGTNNDHPLPHQHVELVKEGEKSGVFVGLGLRGGGMLIDAVCSNDLDKVKTILKKDSCNLYEKDNYGWTALYYACNSKKRYGIAQAILQHEDVLFIIDIAPTTHPKATPLIHAVRQGIPKTVELLVNNCANVNKVDATGSTALHRAIEYKRYGCVQILLSAGANTCIKNKDGKTPFDLDTEGILSTVATYQGKVSKKTTSSLYLSDNRDTLENTSKGFNKIIKQSNQSNAMYFSSEQHESKDNY